MNQISEQEGLLELEYNFICDFIKLRNDLGLSQQKIANEYSIV